ncbi:hypothetical protein BpHYR1_050725, partial [Brachionus plicatilis]
YYIYIKKVKKNCINYCWDPYKRTLNRPKFSETVTLSALAGQPLNGRRLADRPNDRLPKSWPVFRLPVYFRPFISAVQKLDRLADRPIDRFGLTASNTTINLVQKTIIGFGDYVQFSVKSKKTNSTSTYFSLK